MRKRGSGVIWEEKIEKILKQAQETAKRDREEQDLIEEYFSHSGSLDAITKKAHELLQGEKDPTVQELICKNLSDCMLAKIEKERHSLLFWLRKVLIRMKVIPKISRQVQKAENLLREFYLSPAEEANEKSTT